MPPEGAATMTDCYPQLAGGLRSWAKASTRSRNGIPSDEFPIGFFARGGVADRTGTGSSTDFYLATGKDASKTVKLYRWDETEKAVPYTSWQLLKTFAVGSGTGKVYFHVYDPSATPTAVYITHDNPGSADQGLWRIAYSNGALTQITTHNGIRAFTVHQERMVYGTSESNGTRLRYSEPASETFDAANTLDVLPDLNLSDNAWVKSFFGDLLIGKEAAPFTSIQGDINDPVTRILADTNAPALHQVISETPLGLVYVAYKDGYYVTRTGVEIDQLSKQLDPDDVAGTNAVIGSLSGRIGIASSIFAAPFLLTPSGKIYDHRTQCWFATSEWGLNSSRPIGKVMAYDRHAGEHRVYVLTDEVDFDILEFAPDEGAMERLRTYTYKSPKLRVPGGRRICIREVVVPLKVNANGASCRVTVNGVTREITGIASGAQAVRFPFNEEAEYLDVTIVPDSGSASVEAPILETGAVGSIEGHLLAADTVATV